MTAACNVIKTQRGKAATREEQREGCAPMATVSTALPTVETARNIPFNPREPASLTAVAIGNECRCEQSGAEPLLL